MTLEKKLKEELSTTNKGILFDQLSQYQFKIKNFYTYTEKDYEKYKQDRLYFEKTEQTLPNDEVKPNEIEEFLDNLIFAVNHPNENELEDLIKAELTREFYIKFDYIGKSDNAYNSFRRECWIG